MDKKWFDVKVVDFTAIPGPSLRREGEFSGEEFRETVLFPKVKEAMEKKKTLYVSLDGTAGYSAAFLEEAFVGLIKKDKVPYSWLKQNLIIIAEEEKYLVNDINGMLEDAGERKIDVRSHGKDHVSVIIGDMTKVLTIDEATSLKEQLSGFLWNWAGSPHSTSSSTGE